MYSELPHIQDNLGYFEVFENLRITQAILIQDDSGQFFDSKIGNPVYFLEHTYK